MLISLCRYFLLKTWPDFAESTEAANQQVALFVCIFGIYGFSYLLSQLAHMIIKYV